MYVFSLYIFVNFVCYIGDMFVRSKILVIYGLLCEVIIYGIYCIYMGKWLVRIDLVI